MFTSLSVDLDFTKSAYEFAYIQKKKSSDISDIPIANNRIHKK